LETGLKASVVDVDIY